jgi:hypothetical protein
VADRQPWLDRILAFEDMDVGAANSCGGDANQRIAGPDVGDRLFPQCDLAWFQKYGGLHGGHCDSFGGFERSGKA